MAKTGGSFGHEKLEPWEHLHVSAGSYDGGQCLARHESNYVQRDSCSYRWQAVKRAFGEDKDIYNSHPDPTRRLSGTGWGVVAASQIADYQARRVLAGVGTKQWTAQSGRNEGSEVRNVLAQAFRTGFAPYANQAHHLLPNSRLRESVFQVTEPAPEVTDIVFQGLLKEKYNLNHWKNMMILPCESKDGGVLGLPTHPNNHSNYSAEVETAVIRALQPYEAVVKAIAEKKKKKEHPKPEAKKLKNALVSISNKLHTMIVNSRSLIKDRYSQGEDITVDTLHPQVATALGV